MVNVSRSEKVKASWQIPEIRTARIEGAKKTLNTPEARNRKVNNSIKMWNAPGYRETHSCPRTITDKCTIALTKGYSAIIDAEDYNKISKHLWFAAFRNHTVYAVRKSGKILLHHEIVGEIPSGFDVDHINGNGLDNRKENLRVVTRRRNLTNRHGEKSSKYPGVCWHKNKLRWYASIWFAGKRHHLGSFINEEDAANAYLRAFNAIEQNQISSINDFR